MRRMIVVAAALATFGSASSGFAQTTVRGSSPAVERSKALVGAPAGDPFAATAAIPAATARVVAEEVARDVPLPGGGTFAGVRWEEAVGVVSRTEIAGVLQYNAACQWLRAWRDGREHDAGRKILADVPAWPAWRFTEGAGVLAQVAADVRAGGGELASGMLADCDASHEREVAYAAARGLTPSR
jgi:hypothetical protein